MSSDGPLAQGRLFRRFVRCPRDDDGQPPARDTPDRAEHHASVSPRGSAGELRGASRPKTRAAKGHEHRRGYGHGPRSCRGPSRRRGRRSSNTVQVSARGLVRQSDDEDRRPGAAGRPPSTLVKSVGCHSTKYLPRELPTSTAAEYSSGRPGSARPPRATAPEAPAARRSHGDGGHGPVDGQAEPPRRRRSRSRPATCRGPWPTPRPPARATSGALPSCGACRSQAAVDQSDEQVADHLRAHRHPGRQATPPPRR